MGAGVIPFAVYNNQLWFLFQTVSIGRKAGFYIDFGGGLNDGEKYQEAAAREFIEETDTLFFSKNDSELKVARRTPERIADQLLYMRGKFQQTLDKYPHWWCRREPGQKIPAKDWISYFIQLEYRALEPINRQWHQYSGPNGRFKKSRQLHWITAEHLLVLYQNEPEKLWKRVRQLIDVQELIREIKTEIL